VLTLDLAGIAPATSQGVKRWVLVPARIANATERVGGGVRGAGAAWVAVETLDMARRASVSTTVDAEAFGYERIPAAVPPGADSVFAGYYLPDDPFGSVSASFTTDRSR
jgi:hypothetical protein